MYKQIGRTSIDGHMISLYRLNRTQLTLYTVHTDTSIVSGYFVFIFFILLLNRL